MYQSQKKYYEKNKEDLRKKARQKYHDNKKKNTVFTIRYGEFHPFREKECIHTINGMGTTH